MKVDDLIAELKAAPIDQTKVAALVKELAHLVDLDESFVKQRRQEERERHALYAELCLSSTEHYAWLRSEDCLVRELAGCALAAGHDPADAVRIARKTIDLLVQA
jgi:hypothetical protein